MKKTRNVALVDDSRLWQRDDELAAVSALADLRHDRVPDVPREYERVRGLPLVEGALVHDRDVRPRGVLADLQRSGQLADRVDELRGHTGVGEERAGTARRPETDDRPFLARLDEEL